MLGASVQLYRNAYSGLSKEIWWLSLVTFINRCGTMVIPFLTVYLTDRGYTLAQAGYMMAAFGTGAIVGGFIGGKMTDRFGFFHVQVVSLLLNGILFIVLGYMETLFQIGICIFILSSLGEAFRPANSAAIAAYSNDATRTRSYSLNRLAINLGFGIGPAVGGLLASKSYTLLFWADGITCVLASLVLYMMFSPKRTAQEEKKPVQQSTATINSAYKDQIFLLGMFYIFLVGLCFFQMFSTIPVYYEDHIHLSKKTIGLVLALNGLLIAAIEMVLVYKLENRRNPVFYLVLGALMIGFSFLMLDMSRTFAMIVSSMIVITFGEMFLFPFMNNFWVKRSNERNRGQYAAVYTMSFSLAIVLAPTFSSQVATLFSFDVLWLVNFIICSIAALGFYLLQKQMNHE